MEPRLTRLLSSCEKAPPQLTKALAQPKDEFVRGAAIQRFEFTFELFWKTLQAYCQMQGLEANSPRASLRQAFRLGLMDDDSRYMAMLQSRNLASHTYEETVAETIHASLPTFADTTHAVVAKIQTELEGEEEPSPLL
jgi:nucleotidyltransferase substrate binding protein (TIGR01987 family)